LLESSKKKLKKDRSLEKIFTSRPTSPRSVTTGLFMSPHLENSTFSHLESPKMTILANLCFAYTQHLPVRIGVETIAILSKKRKRVVKYTASQLACSPVNSRRREGGHLCEERPRTGRDCRERGNWRRKGDRRFYTADDLGSESQCRSVERDA
jgi:hypothetical protein